MGHRTGIKFLMIMKINKQDHISVNIWSYNIVKGDILFTLVFFSKSCIFQKLSYGKLLAVEYFDEKLV